MTDHFRSTMLALLLPMLAGTAVEAAEGCSDTRTAYADAPTLALAESHIACLEGLVFEIGVVGDVAEAPLPSWVPRRQPGGPKPMGPNYRELQEYLEWLKDQYVWDEANWALGVGAVLPENSWVLDVTVPEEEASAIGGGEDMRLLQFEGELRGMARGPDDMLGGAQLMEPGQIDTQTLLEGLNIELIQGGDLK